MATRIEGGDKLAVALAKLATKVKRAGTLEVGFMEGATYPDGTSVALVAAVNEFGRPAKGQPPRPFFRGMVARGEGRWGGELGKLLTAADYDAPRALAIMGEQLEGELKQSIADLTSPALAPSTVAAKGFDKPLVDTGHMLNSATHRVKE